MANQISMAQEIVQSMLSSIDIVINGRLKELAFDKTIEGQIIEKDSERECAYRIQYQDSILIAYAKDTDSFYKGDTVLIHIPQGNFNNQKTILGKKTNNDFPTGVYNFKLPFDDFVGLNRLTLNGGEWQEPKGFRANDPDDGFHLVGTGDPIFTFPDPNASISTQETQRRLLEKVIGSTKLGIEVDIQTLLGAEMPISGDYGLKILITGITKSSDTSVSEEQTLYGDFTTADMYGNPYNFLLPYTQEKLFDVSNFLSISKIQIYFMQDWNFKANTNTAINYLDSITEDKLPPNILFSNMNLFLGLTADELTEDKVFLYSYDESKYSTAEDTKELHLTWIHKTENGFMAIDNLDETPFHIEDDGENTRTKYDVEIYWYRKVLGSLNTNKYGGEDWEIINHTIEIPEYLGVDDNGEDIIEVNQILSLQDYNFTIVPDINQNFDRFKAVVVYGNKAYTCESNLIFQNSVDVETLNESLRGSAEIVLKCFSFAKNADGTEALVEDPWNCNFYIYDNNGRSIYDDFGVAFSDKTYYLKLYKRASNGEYYPLNTDASSSLITVSWGDEESWTHRYSMIESFRHVMPTELIYDKVNDQFMRAFTISNYYNIKNNDNTLIVTISIDGRTYYINKTLSFGHAGTQGTQCSVSIEIDGSNKGLIVGSPFKLICNIRDEYGNLLVPNENSDITYEWRYLSSENAITNIVQSGKYFEGVLSIPEPPIFFVTVRGNFSKYPLTISRGFLVCDNVEFFDKCDFILPDRIQFQSDGTSPIYNSSTFEIINTETNVNYYPTWALAFAEDESSSASNSWKEYYSLASESIGGYTAMVQKIVDDVFEGYERAEFDPIVKYSLAASRLIWTDEMAGENGFNYIYTTFDIDEETSVFVGQSIALAQNTYSSSLVNTWNGKSLDIDEENGTILTKSIAAGTKDSKNRFTGVMLGDWAENADDSLEISGLYGFQQGVQTFGFKRDGTAFIGKSGGGQINFDGNKAMMSNYDGSCYINLNPSILENNLFNLNSVAGSPYFLYSRIHRDNTNDIRINKDWANQFLNDRNYDYFVVDPNQGIVTSGTILANSGVIGNWEISKFGLLQGYDYPTLDNSGRYVYLGYSPMTDDEYNRMESVLISNYSSLSQDLTNQYNIDKAEIESTYLAEKSAAQNKYYSNVDVANQNFVENDQDRLNELAEIDELENSEKSTLYENYRSSLNSLKQEYTTEQNELRRQYTEDLQALAMSNLPAICNLDPQHFLNYLEPLQIVYDCVKENFLNNDAFYREETDSNHIREIIWNEMVEVTQDFGHWYAQYHDHYLFQNGQITRIPNISVAQLNLIAALTGITVGQGTINSVPESVDRYGQKVLYNQALGTYTLSDESTWHSTSNTLAINIEYFKNLLNEEAITGFILVPTLNGSSGSGNNNYSLPWTRERLEAFVMQAELALTALQEGYERQLQYMMNAAESALDEELSQNLYNGLLNDLNNLRIEYEEACASVPVISEDVLQEITDRYDVLRAEIELRYSAQTEIAKTNLEKELNRLKSVLNNELAIAQKARDSALATLKRIYNNDQQDINIKLGEAISNIYKYDNNKYAIYIGEHSIYNQAENEVPLFSVRWDGAMQVRKGLIGNNSPWVISDDGIAQTIIPSESDSDLTTNNFFGTIYLGNPMKDTDLPDTDETEYRIYNDYIGILNNNEDNIISSQSGGEIWAEKKYSINGYKVRDRIEYLGLAHYTTDGWTRKNTNARLIRYLDNSEKFCFYAGTDHINLGLRIDGYLFSQYGLIAGWHIEPNRLIKYGTNDEVLVELNSGTSSIHLNNNNIVLDGVSGAVKIGTNQTSGLVNISGYYINGGSQQYTDVTITSIYANTNTDDEDPGNSDITLPGQTEPISNLKFTYNYLYGNLTVTPQNLQGGLLQLANTVENNVCGLNIVSNPTNGWVALSPTALASDSDSFHTGYLLNWNISAESIYSKSIYTDGNIIASNIYLDKGNTKQIGNPPTEQKIYELVATEYWVAQITNKLQSSIRSVTSSINTIKTAVDGSISSVSYQSGTFTFIKNDGTGFDRTIQASNIINGATNNTIQADLTYLKNKLNELIAAYNTTAHSHASSVTIKDYTVMRGSTESTNEHSHFYYYPASYNNVSASGTPNSAANISTLT